MSNSSPNTVINNKYMVNTIIGKGAFGVVYCGINNKNNEKIAIKLEQKHPLCTIKNEANILKYLQEQKCYFVPTLYWFGVYNDFYTIVIPLYDCNLYDYHLNQTMSTDEFCSIALKMLSIIEHIHSAFVLHRDIKPQHFMLRNNEIYLVDFGLSNFYIDENRRLIRDVSNDSLIGSQNYVSCFIHEGHRYSRRDDLISVAYVLLLLDNKTLPWSYVNDVDFVDDNYNNIHIMHCKNQEIKRLKTLDTMHESMKDTYTFLVDYITFCYRLDYYETPEYVSYFSLFTC
jgi:serine/threonine protein kinase